jgi:outer membrane protein OmpA-like peptidoglycan-associated protein
MLKLALLALALAALRADAEPADLSQHPRIGEMAEIDFDQGSAQLPTASGDHDKLGRVAGWALTHIDGLIVLDGHADRNDGTPAVQLSMSRAEAVRDQLVTLGVDRDRIVLAAFGADGNRSRAVTVWTTHEGLDPVVARLQASGAFAVVWGAQAIPPLATQ